MNHFLPALMLTLVACAPPPPPPEYHNILGTSYGWDKEKNKIEVLLDAKIDKLQLRHVRRSSASCVSGYAEHIEVSGEVGPDSTAAVERLLPQLHLCENINANANDESKYISNEAYLSSGGGLLKDGYALGDLFRKNSIGAGWLFCLQPKR